MAENVKKKFGINIIDILIILVCLLALIVFSYFAMGKWEANKSDSAGKAVLNYTVEIKDVPLETASNFFVGDIVKDIRKGTNIGKIVAVDEPSVFRTVTENKADGKFEMSEVPGRFKTRITVETSFKESIMGYSVDDVDIKVGKTLTIKTDKAASDSVILSIEKKEGVK